MPKRLHKISRFGNAIFSLIESFVHSPSFFRSSGASTTPCLIASVGQLTKISLPSSSIVPPFFASTPNSARVDSVRPAPISPAMPRISPSYTSNDTSRTILPAERFFIENIFLPLGIDTRGNFSLISRPTIFLIISSIRMSLNSPRVMNFPSRMIVTRSAMSCSSSRRCDM